jgi:hypothetical protein
MLYRALMFLIIAIVAGFWALAALPSPQQASQKYYSSSS